MDCRERGSHARGMYLTQYTSRIGTAIGRGGHKRNSNRVVRNLEEKNVGTKGKSPKQRLISAKDLTIQLPEGCQSPYHILD